MKHLTAATVVMAIVLGLYVDAEACGKKGNGRRGRGNKYGHSRNGKGKAMLKGSDSYGETSGDESGKCFEGKRKRRTRKRPGFANRSGKGGAGSRSDGLKGNARSAAQKGARKPEVDTPEEYDGGGKSSGQEGATTTVSGSKTKSKKQSGNNGVGNGVDPAPPGTPPVNDGSEASPGSPGNKGGANKK